MQNDGGKAQIDAVGGRLHIGEDGQRILATAVMMQQPRIGGHADDRRQDDDGALDQRPDILQQPQRLGDVAGLVSDIHQHRLGQRFAIGAGAELLAGGGDGSVQHVAGQIRPPGAALDGGEIAIAQHETENAAGAMMGGQRRRHR